MRTNKFITHQKDYGDYDNNVLQTLESTIIILIVFVINTPCCSIPCKNAHTYTYCLFNICLLSRSVKNRIILLKYRCKINLTTA